MQEDDVEDDPADGQQTEKCAEHRRQSGQLGRHAEGDDRHRQCAQEPDDGGQMRPHMKREQSKQDDNRNRRGKRGQQDAIERVVGLSPNHFFLLVISWMLGPDSLVRRGVKYARGRSWYYCPARACDHLGTSRIHGTCSPRVQAKANRTGGNGPIFAVSATPRASY